VCALPQAALNAARHGSAFPKVFPPVCFFERPAGFPAEPSEIHTITVSGKIQ